MLVEDGGHEEEDGVAEEPQEASLQRTGGRARDELRVCTRFSGGCVSLPCYLGEAEVEVSLQGAPLSGDDLVEDGGQQQGEDYPESHEEETCQTLLGVVAVMFAL